MSFPCLHTPLGSMWDGIVILICLKSHPSLSFFFLKQMYGMDGLMELLRISDFVVVAAALTEETEGMLGKDQFSHSKKGQILINVGRGPIIIEEDLISALENGQLAGAALDVFCVEPLPKESKIWDMENVLLSPHNADQLIDYRHKSVQFFCENCTRFLANVPLENNVSASKGY